MFAKLKSSGDIGRNLVETIELELSTTTHDDTIVSKVILML